MINIFEHYRLGEKLYEQTVSKVYRKHNLTYMEFTIIMFIANNPNFDTASDIVKYRCLTKSHVSSSIKSLENKGLIVGAFNENNKRSIHLKLTDKATVIVDEGHDIQKQYVNLIHSGLTDEDKETMLKIIEKINKNINEHLDI